MEQKTALITGSAQGIGLGVARALAARGWAVHVVHRSGPASAELVAEFGARRVHRAALVLAEDAERLVAEVLAVSGRLDAVVHAVGPYLTAPLAATNPHRVGVAPRSDRPIAA